MAGRRRPGGPPNKNPGYASDWSDNIPSSLHVGWQGLMQQQGRRPTSTRSWVELHCQALLEPSSNTTGAAEVIAGAESCQVEHVWNFLSLNRHHNHIMLVFKGKNGYQKRSRPGTNRDILEIKLYNGAITRVKQNVVCQQSPSTGKNNCGSYTVCRCPGDVGRYRR